ncbi:eCIS core domain-containing protein [Hydrogenimonas sp.]
MRQRTGEKDFTGETKKAVRRAGKPKGKGRGDALADLHRGVGNRAVRRLFTSGFVRGKLKVSEAGDRYEREADETAERIMRMPEGERLSSPPSPTGESAPVSVSPALEARIDALRGGGRPLPPKARAFFEPRFGRDFSDVRLHTGGEAGRLAGILRARAFTRGADIVFAPGEYRPDTFEGKRLLAHELVHVMQQQNNQMSIIARQSWEEGLSAILKAGPIDAYRAHELAQEALKAAEQTGLPGLHNGPADAWRHCYWNCRMVQVIGKEDAADIAENHETYGNNPLAEWFMDTWNNREGRECSGDCDTCCYSKLNRGRLLVLDRRGRLHFSMPIRHGSTPGVKKYEKYYYFTDK